MVISRFIIMVIVFPEYEVIMVRLGNSVFPDFDNDSPNSLTRVRDPFN